MPLYAYRCDHCGVQFDRHQSFTDEPLRICPECGEPALRKLYQPVGIVFKGKGFYSTDNRSPSGLHSNKSNEKDETKSESKPDAKADTPTDTAKKSDE